VQGFPVNRTAHAARVVEVAQDPGFRLVVDGNVQRTLSLSSDDLLAMPQHEATLPISCVEGWSTSQRWRGVRMRDLLDLVGAEPDAEVVVRSLEANRSSRLNRSHAHDVDTLLALAVNGETLDLDHGYPVRLIGPNRPGTMQTKWVTRVEVV
jgi:DMSO/TMAO reductase YedYZ molybdopterin-dependent catalytic subunit